jgi:septation ring formation regulator EzrA
METAEEISLKIDEVDKKILAASENLDTVDQAIHSLRRELITKGLDLDNLRQESKKGRHNLQRLKVEKDMLTRKFWRSK